MQHVTDAGMRDFIRDLNYLIDKDKHKGVTISAIRTAFASGDVIEWLKNDIGKGHDFSYWNTIMSRELTEELQGMWDAYANKLGYFDNGICLLIELTMMEISYNNAHASP